MGQKPLDNLDLFDDLPNPVGRPKQFASNAERQKAYRARLKAQGKRVITKVVADVREGQELRSDVIDLSEVKQKNDVSISKMTKTQVRQHLGFLGFDALTASKSSPARLIDSDNIRQIVSTI